MTQIAILITCFNRKDKTLGCLKSIYSQYDIEKYHVETFIVDGGSSDGTIDAVRKQYPYVHVELRTGLFWAGGMRVAWKMADSAGTFDYYWLLNDDTTVRENCLEQLMMSDEQCRKDYGKAGIIVGGTCDNNGNYTYGGIKLVKLERSNGYRVIPSDKMQEIDLGNANIMLVPSEVYKAIGGFCEVYTHGCADYDYTLRARHQDIPVILAPTYLGKCENDHGHSWKSQNSSLRERIKFLYSPKGLAYKEYLYYIRTFFPSEYYSAKFKLWMKTLFPIIWTKFKK